MYKRMKEPSKKILPLLCMNKNDKKQDHIVMAGFIAYNIYVYGLNL